MSLKTRRNPVDHSHSPGVPEHPKTFDEVIARGFPHEHLEALKKAHQERARKRPAPTAAKLPRATRAVAATTRKDAGTASFSPDEQTAFENAIVRLVEEGKYLELVQNHMDM